jgi:signal transduction histidine kinase
MNLRQWILKNLFRNTILICLLVLGSQIFYLLFLYKDESVKKQNLVDQAAVIMQVALSQYNRTLAEATILNLYKAIEAKSVIVCSNAEKVISYPPGGFNCNTKTSEFGILRYEKKIPGSSNDFIVASYPFISNLISILGILTSSILFVVGFIFLILRLHQSLRQDILDPILNDFHSNARLNISELEIFRQKNEELISLKLNEENIKARAEVSRQVAHDIRSPLSALSLLSAYAPELPEEKITLLRNAVTRITDIANILHSKSSVPSDEKKAESLALCIEEIISEKRPSVERGRVNIKFELSEHHYNIFSNINATQFKRVVSNLLNNSIEAVLPGGQISVALNGISDTEVQVIIKDDGKGIPKEILGHVFEKDFTYGKATGSGLGLYHAHQQVKTWGGKILADSTPGEGTTMVIALKRSPPPKWWCQGIDLTSVKRIVVADDSPSIHDLWKSKIKTIELLSCFDLQSLETRLTAGVSDSFFVFDFQRDIQNVLDTLSKFENARAVLCSNLTQEPQIVSRCAELGIQCIPKSLASIVPVK